jgi:hypothetical protein
MPENDIIAEIHRHREEVARECDFDPAKLIAYYRRRELERRDDGHPLVTLSPAEVESPVMREEPPKK